MGSATQFEGCFLVRVILLALTLGLLVSCSGPTLVEEVTSATTTNGTDTTVTGGQTLPQTAPPSGNAGEETAELNTTAPVAETVPNPNGATRSESTAMSPAVGENGMVSSANPLATEAGLEVLADGGNAYDAAVAVAASLGVVEPMMNGIGGYGATVIYDAKSDETRFLGASSRVPEKLDLSVFYPPTPEYLENRSGAAAISTPGAVNDWEALWEEYGSLKWERLLEPAIGYADDGFVLNAENAGWISSEFYNFPVHAQEVYGNAGVPLQAGDSLVQEDLANSLRLISERGAEAVYGGELGEAMASAAQQNGGFMTMEDLQRNRAEWKPTIGIDYRGWRVETAPPPNTSWNSLTRLGVMSRFDPASLDHNSPAYLDVFAQVTEQAYYERQEYAADPEVETTPLDMLLSESYWSDQAANIDPALASSESPEMKSTELASATAAGEREHTTHFVVADSEGNVVSMTQTLGNIFGSRVMPEGTGIWLNNSISYARFDATDGSFNVVPGGYRLPGISPTLVMRDGKPRVALGNPRRLLHHPDHAPDANEPNRLRHGHPTSHLRAPHSLYGARIARGGSNPPRLHLRRTGRSGIRAVRGRVRSRQRPRPHYRVRRCRRARPLYRRRRPEERRHRGRVLRSVEIRDYKKSDATEIVRLFYGTVHSINRADYSPEQIEAWAPEVPEAILWHCRMVARKTLVAVEKNEVVGFAELEKDGHLDMFYLRKDAVGRGVGLCLYRAVENEARALKLGRIFTEASITARPFFGRQGFRVVREQTVWRRGVGLTNFVMEKPIER